MSLLQEILATVIYGVVGGAYVRDKNTSGRLCAKNAGGGGICTWPLRIFKIVPYCTILTILNGQVK